MSPRTVEDILNGQRSPKKAQRSSKLSGSATPSSPPVVSSRSSKIPARKYRPVFSTCISTVISVGIGSCTSPHESISWKSIISAISVCTADGVVGVCVGVGAAAVLVVSVVDEDGAFSAGKEDPGDTVDAGLMASPGQSECY